jgi:hypothetical protein
MHLVETARAPPFKAEIAAVHRCVQVPSTGLVAKRMQTADRGGVLYGPFSVDGRR